MSHCGGCGGNCSGCSGCAGSLVLTKPEVEMLQKFAQIPFLPVARKMDDMVPVYLEETDCDYSVILTHLEKKGLIDMDYHMPLSGFCYDAYSAYPLKGSMALTTRGQQVLEMLELQGAEEA